MTGRSSTCYYEMWAPQSAQLGTVHGDCHTFANMGKGQRRRRSRVAREPETGDTRHAVRGGLNTESTELVAPMARKDDDVLEDLLCILRSTAEKASGLGQPTRTRAISKPPIQSPASLPVTGSIRARNSMRKKASDQASGSRDAVYISSDSEGPSYQTEEDAQSRIYHGTRIRCKIDRDVLWRFDEGEFLNDVIVNVLIDDALSKSNSAEVRTFESYLPFYLKSKGAAHVSRWITSENAEHGMYWLSPVNEHHHWYLIVIKVDVWPPRIASLDSLGSAHQEMASKYLELVASCRERRVKGVKLDYNHVPVMSQEDNHSCGVWAIENAYCFMREPAAFFDWTVSGKNRIRELTTVSQSGNELRQKFKQTFERLLEAEE